MIQVHTALYKPTKACLQAEEFARFLKDNTQYFISGDRLFVFIPDKRCYEFVSKSRAMTWMDSLIDRSYEGTVSSSALTETYRKLLRDSTRVRSQKDLLDKGQFFLNLRNGVLELKSLRLLKGKESEDKAVQNRDRQHMSIPLYLIYQQQLLSSFSTNFKIIRQISESSHTKQMQNML